MLIDNYQPFSSREALIAEMLGLCYIDATGGWGELTKDIWQAVFDEKYILKKPAPDSYFVSKNLKDLAKNLCDQK